MPTDEETTTPIDLRGLEPPEPLARILSALEGAGPLSFLLSREPLLLYPLLRREGWRHRTRRTDDGVVELTLERERMISTAPRRTPR